MSSDKTMRDDWERRPDETRIEWKRRLRAEATRSNGHTWTKGFLGLGIESCMDCGYVRREDDQNKPCRGPVRVGPR